MTNEERFDLVSLPHKLRQAADMLERAGRLLEAAGAAERLLRQVSTLAIAVGDYQRPPAAPPAALAARDRRSPVTREELVSAEIPVGRLPAAAVFDAAGFERVKFAKKCGGGRAPF
jgi:hypothetical protein